MPSLPTQIDYSHLLANNLVCQHGMGSKRRRDLRVPGRIHLQPLSPSLPISVATLQPASA